MKKNIKFVIILMSFAMIGIIGFQIFWVKNSFRQNIERFDKDVKDALLSSLNKEKTQRYYKANTQFVVKYSGNLPFIIVDSSLHNSKIYMSDSTEDLIITKNFEDSVRNSHVDSTSFTIIDGLDKRRIYSESGTKNFVFDYENTTAHLRIDIQANDVFDYIYQDARPFGPVYSQINYSDLDSIYKFELTKNNIDIQFVMGSWNTISQTFVYINNDEANIDRLVKGYSAFINPGDILNQEVLLTYFPLKSKYIVKKMGGILFASIFMILIILGSFGFALLTILKQKRLSEIKNDFINNMTHELKTPISTVSLAIEALQKFDILNDKERTKQYLDISRNENARLGMIVEKVLKISAFEKKEINLNFEKTDCHHLIQQITKNVEVQINNKGGKLNLDLSAKRYFAEADQIHLTNVIYNLIDNAIKYSPYEPEITVFTKDTPGKLMIAVKDKGIGIAVQQQKRIFDKFYRVPTGNLHNVKGYGLGLSYVADILKKHNGLVKLDSEQGKGSLFKIYIPLESSIIKNRR